MADVFQFVGASPVGVRNTKRSSDAITSSPRTPLGRLKNFAKVVHGRVAMWRPLIFTAGDTFAVAWRLQGLSKLLCKARIAKEEKI